MIRKLIFLKSTRLTIYIQTTMIYVWIFLNRNLRDNYKAAVLPMFLRVFHTSVSIVDHEMEARELKNPNKQKLD